MTQTSGQFDINSFSEEQLHQLAERVNISDHQKMGKQDLVQQIQQQNDWQTYAQEMKGSQTTQRNS